MAASFTFMSLILSYNNYNYFNNLITDLQIIMTNLQVINRNIVYPEAFIICLMLLQTEHSGLEMQHSRT